MKNTLEKEIKLYEKYSLRLNLYKKVYESFKEDNLLAVAGKFYASNKTNLSKFPINHIRFGKNKTNNKIIYLSHYSDVLNIKIQITEINFRSYGAWLDMRNLSNFDNVIFDPKTKLELDKIVKENNKYKGNDIISHIIVHYPNNFILFDDYIYFDSKFIKLSKKELEKLKTLLIFK